jgi:hypothetical protein
MKQQRGSTSRRTGSSPSPSTPGATRKLPTFDEVYGRFSANLKARAKAAEAGRQLSHYAHKAKALQAEGKIREARAALAQAERWLVKHERLKQRIQ